MNFAKLQARGNDFLVIFDDDLPAGASPNDLAVAMCDRHYGAGADGLIVADTKNGDAERDCSSRIFNADGGEAEVSGNGTRCLAAYLLVTGLWPEGSEVVRIGTVAGVKPVRLVERRASGGLFEMEMGVPKFASVDVPMLFDVPLERVIGYPLEVDGATYEVTALSVGNPHCSLLLDDLDSVDFRELGPKIERHPRFPQRVNVEFVQALAPDRIRVRFWERGAGETLSSGTGSSAAVVAAAVNGRSGREVTIETPAGELGAHWRDSDDVVLLTGPAELVYRGKWAGK